MSSKLLRVALVWNGTVINERILRKPEDVVVGPSPKAMFVVPAADVEEHVLFTPSGSEYTASLLSGMDGQVTLAGDNKAISALGTSFQIRPGDYGVLTIGEVSIFFQWVDDEGAILGASPLSTVDFNLASTVLVAAVVHMLLLLFAFITFDPELRRASMEFPDRFVRILAQEPPDILEEEEDEVPDETMSEAAAGEEGEFGDPEDETETELPDHDAPLVEELETPELGRAFDAAIAESGALTNIFQQNDSFANQFGADFATAGEGDAFNAGHGSLGLGGSGSGSGGGGFGAGRAGGVGSLDTGGGRGQGAAVGRRQARAPQARVERGSPSVSGFLTREQIERVVRRHSRGIRFCYERELQTDPSLGGRVAVNWTVGLDGRVTAQSVVENTMGNRNVESCILREVSRMRFDEPDGGMVNVTYPFTFRSAE